ncbi:SAM-dependent methyltransferase [Streptomyces antioxidans]|uniref:SAM-dependent methyltransferase n=1 Tax=Streptomyces antioxidans TaxID=1507734 RepID=A0A1V4CWN9_9ACTN|nr:class I SAM-dependent methyltransferase [Streptomyces antioxidans]OPF72363.1 SAM-dependent methyltransferase [Streptomyces antioxidans]
MDRQRRSHLAHADHPIAAPVADESVARLLDRAVADGAERALDLGCGGGEWLRRLLVRHPRLRAEGVDVHAEALERAREGAEESGVADRLVLHETDAAAFAPAHRFDVVLSVGAAHAFGGLLPTLAAARALLAPEGRVVVGDGFWERAPDAAALSALGATRDDHADLPTTVDRVVADGWTPVYGHVSTAGEWDDYEWSWTGSLSRWALDHREEPDALDAYQAAAEHRTQWLAGYRGTLGFVTLVLRRSP